MNVYRLLGTRAGTPVALDRSARPSGCHDAMAIHTRRTSRIAAPVASSDDWPSRPYSEDVIVPHRGFRHPRTLVQQLTSLAGASGIALLVPIAILIIGIPIALVARGVAEALGWLMGGLLN